VRGGFGDDSEGIPEARSNVQASAEIATPSGRDDPQDRLWVDKISPLIETVGDLVDRPISANANNQF
jgi:hypothetical protein